MIPAASAAFESAAMPAFDAALLDAAGDALPRPFGDTYWLLPGRMLAGEHPGRPGSAAVRARIDALLDAAIVRFVDLTSAQDHVPDYADLLHAHAKARGVAVGYRRFPIPDFDVPPPATMRHIVDFLDSLLDDRKPLYLHCHGGAGRTGTVAGCLLVGHGLLPDEALACVERKYAAIAKHATQPHSPETDAQRAFVRAWRAG